MQRLFFLLFFALFLVALSGFTQVIPRFINAAPGDGRMILFFDGVTIPTGWTCISCDPADPFYQRFVRGAETYGTTGGSLTHNHTYSQAISSSNESAVSENWNSDNVSTNGHNHNLTTNLSAETNLPAYRQLRVIRYDNNGEPSTIPAGAVAIFESVSVPTGWTRYAAQDNRFVYGADTIGVTGGANTHNHDITGTIGADNGTSLGARGGGQQVVAAATAHTHTFSGQTSVVDAQPPYREIVLGQAGADTAAPTNMVAMWDDEQPADWQLRSDVTGPYYERFLKPTTSFGASGGSASHDHPNSTIITSTSSVTDTARSGASGASGNHTHTITASDYSGVVHLPPFIEVIIAKKQDPSDITQSSYRWFHNRNNNDVGLALAAQDNGAISIGLPFRLRLSLSISVADLGQSGESFKLQYAQRAGEVCDPSFNDESYIDVLTSSGDIRYQDNPSVTDGDVLTANLNDPAPSLGDPEIQSYTESNNFTNNINPIVIGDYGLWDFALQDVSAPSDTTYCFRVVYADGSALSQYDVIPELTTDDGAGNMVLLHDGATAPAGWTCISCNPGEPYYQRFARGASSYGATGGSETHSHTADGDVLPTTVTVGGDAGVGALAGPGHGHTISPTLDESSNIPPYRQLKFIRSDTSGTPTSLPAGIIAFFDDTVPAGWTRYAVQDDNYIRGEDTIGATGGSLAHTHTVSGDTSAATGGTAIDGGSGPASAGASTTHQHSLSGTSPNASHEPPFINAVLGELDSNASPPAGLITFWDGTPPGSWESLSGVGEPFYQRFIKPADTYGAVGGSATHTHADHQVATSGPTDTASTRLNGTGSASAAHTHPVDISAISGEGHLPPYMDTVIAKQPVPNSPPNQPQNLEQFRVSLANEISVGGFTNETQVQLRADLSDLDDEDELQLCVEVQPADTAFLDVEQDCGDLVFYNGTAVAADTVLTGLADTEEYHWQARTRDNAGVYSAWVGFGGNAPGEVDFSIDTVDPTGTVYDGDTTGVDITYSDDSLNSLSANWSFDGGLSGIASHEYAIGISEGGTSVQDWTDVSIDTSVQATSLDLTTTQLYFFTVRATDNAGNQAEVSSSGQLVAPSITFSVSQSSITFDALNVSNDFTDTKDITLTTSTNAKDGYVVRARASTVLSGTNGSIPMFSGGSYNDPAEWLTSSVGFGYTSDDPVVQGIDRFSDNPCPGGGAPPCYAPFSLSGDGDIVVDNAGPVSGSPIVDEIFTITSRVTSNGDQPAGEYQTNIIYSATAMY